MKKLYFVMALLVVLTLLGVAACSQPKPADQTFALAISDNSGGNKNGAPPMTLKFGAGTPSATTVVAKKGTPAIDGKDGDAAWGQASVVNLPIPVQKGGGQNMEAVWQRGPGLLPV